MNDLIAMLSLFSILLCGGMLHADYGRYQVILDRQLLGRPPPPAPQATPTPAPPPSPPGWSNEYTMTMMVYDEYRDQVRVGLQHTRDGHGYLLIQGETYDHHEFVLKSTDPARGHATIQRGRDSHVFTLQSGPAIAPPAEEGGGRNVRRVNPNQPQPRRGPPSRPRPETVPDPEPQQSQFESPEQLEAHLQNVQMDAIRTGKPPLPIPLTPEMDAQLVSEGVLPPMEEE